ncbi:hypothetical protein AXF42_Ash019086 [Apostasia shenzhenica]|uniref:Nodal modulator 1 n=1 Tax=Apostasia shenzhenica TaxID=1088818 RepID=A0A2I0BB91_9ASPA|nr:hypothetical protein AXF42_Ash019086 [Apostasia shenzhenica]
MASLCLLVYFLIALAVPLADANSINGCGGFVEATSALVKSRKPSDGKFDYSHITVELRTIDGLVKDSTQCAPNGYYFIPVYDKGSFVVKVKGPDGWSWQPDMVPVIADKNSCNANADINFQLTGFMILGRVLGAVGGDSCPLKDGGPSNVKVELVSHSNEVIASASTSETGHYTFWNVIPGAYKLRASHPNLEIELKGSSEVTLGFGNAQVDDIFVVSGYDLHGSVVFQGNPILGVHVYLYSDDVSEMHCLQGDGYCPSHKKARCRAISDADGKFTFSSIPCGVYELLPYYKGENTVFDVSPPSMFVTVEHHDVTVFQKFQVTGFSVGGRVIDDNGAGVSGASIIVDGHQKVISDDEGYYKLDQVTSKPYTIVVEKDHYKFSSLENFMVLPNMAAVDDIKAIYYDVCGMVRMISPHSIAKVTLKHGLEDVEPWVNLTVENGNFCFEVPPGEYQLSAVAINADSSSSPLFSPPYIDIKVYNPVLDIEFFEAQVDVYGTVLCKGKCSPSVSLSLARLFKGTEQETKIVALSNEGSDFMFPKLFPGKYRMKVKHTSAVTGEDSWCWDQNNIDLVIGTEDVQGIVFVQKGYLVNIISTHDSKAYIKQPDSSIINLIIKPIYVTGEKYHVGGEIHIAASLLKEIHDLSERILVDVFSIDDALIGTIHARPVSTMGDQSGMLVFEYSIWSKLGQEVVFVPRYSSDEGKKILFYPRQRHVSVKSDGCQSAIPSIVGQMGIYVEGSVSPPLAGVKIKIIAAGDSMHSSLRNGDLALVSETGTDGYYSAGPLYDDISYRVEASKPGFHVKEVAPNLFTCQKLGQIVVNIYSSGESEGLFPSVLLSLSGEDGYRNNSISAAGGNFLFDNLFPGSFYLRPLLKEYSFSPAAVAIELESGDSKDIIFHAKRVAYSVLGSVSLLSGQPKEGVYVEARAEYKDLLALPSGKKIIVAQAWIGINFIVFEEPETTILSGHVEGIDLEAFQLHLSVEIRSADDPSNIESVFPLPLSNYFQVRDLAKGRHLVQLRPGLLVGKGRFESEVLEVDLEKQPQVHVGPLKFKVVEHHHKQVCRSGTKHLSLVQELTPAPVFPLFIGVFVIVLFISLPRLKDLYLTAVERGTAAIPGKKDSRKPVLRKRVN